MSGEILTGSGPLMTVVMSCYNQAEYVAQAIESVLMQRTDFSVRLIVTDDHSAKDGSVAVIRDYAARYPDRVVALTHAENGRYLKNVLRAMAHVKSEYFTLLDADDYWTDENYLADAVRFLESHPGYTVYGRNIMWRTEDGKEGVQCGTEQPDADFDFGEFLSSGHATPLTPSAVFRNVVFRNGIPQFLLDAVGTDLERPYDGDVFRFFQHLSVGRYRFENKVSGVYRMVSGGIFIGMSPVSRQLIQAFCFVAYARHFERHLPWFAERAWRCFLEAVSDLPREILAGRPAEEAALRALGAVVEFLSQNRDKIGLRDPVVAESPADRLALWAYGKIGKRLARHGLLEAHRTGVARA